MRVREIEKILKADGWRLKTTKGSHCQYVHSAKPGKVTVPRRAGDVDIRTARSIFRQAGIEWPPGRD